MTHLALILTPLLEQASGQGGVAPGCGGSNMMLVTMGLVFAIFYFLIIRPGQKREKDRQAMLNALKPGETVVTGGGLIGKITGTSDRYVVLEISPRVRVRVLRAQITGKEEEAEKSQTQKSGRKSKGKKKEGVQGKGRKSPAESKSSDSSESSESSEDRGDESDDEKES